MAGKPPYPYAIITTKNPFYARSSHFRRRVNFNNVEHARNYCRKAVKPDWSHWKHDNTWHNLNRTVKITVWLAEGQCHIWIKGQGWTK